MKNILWLLLFAVTSSIYSQNTFSGTITDAETGDPVFSANIYFPEIEKGAVTGDDGRFSISNLPEGNFRLVISSIGYTSINQQISLPSDALDFQLKPSAVEMEEVIVSTPFHQLQSQNVMKVERESVSDLQKRGAVSLAEGVTQIPGVESITTGVGIGKPVIRGLSSNRVLVYTQGVRLENQQFGDEHGLGINSMGIGSVEVIKGPASLLYGSDAIGGVLYLNPESYAAANSFQANFMSDYFSNTHGYQESAMVGSSGDQWKFMARGSLSAHSDYEGGDGLRVTNTRFKERDLKLGTGFQNSKYKADLRYNFNRSEIGIPEEMGVQSLSKEPMLPFQNIDNHVLSLDNRIFLKNSTIDAKLGYQFNNRKEFEDEHHHEEEGSEETEDHEEHEGEELHPALEMHLSTLSYNLKYNFPDFGNLQLVAGSQGMHQQNENFGKEMLIPNAVTNDVGVFTTAHYHLPKWDFQGGLRYDHRSLKTEDVSGEELFPEIDRNFSSFNAAFGTKYSFSDQLTARLNLATGFRAPNLAELTSNGSHNGANRYEIGNANLTNEQNFQVDLALEWRNEHFEAYINAFRNGIADYIFISPTDEIVDGENVYRYIQDNAVLYGGEAGYHFHPHPLDWLHVEGTFETVTGKRGDDYLPLIPASALTTTLRTEFQGGKTLLDKYIFTSLKNVFDKEEIGYFETRTGGYSLLSAGFGSSINLGEQTLQFSLSGNNLLNKTYVSHLSRLKMDGIPNIGRNIKVSVRWDI
ncbi:MAG: TonB-dependent receptor [Christiangramia sp.]|nr:TonB-dependent receptor [Christiangramia sp.]